MRIFCPNCSTEYEVPDAALAGRSRKLRCERCGTKWRTGAAEPAPEPVWTQAAPAWPVERSETQAAAAPGATAPAVPAPVAPVAAAPAADAPARWAAPEPDEPTIMLAPAVAQQVAQAARLLPETASDGVMKLPEPEVAPRSESIVAAPARQFGKPVDEEAQAEIAQAVSQEQVAAPAPASELEALPAFLTAARGPEPAALSDADKVERLGEIEDTIAATDRFAELVYAARNKSIEFEPDESPRAPPVRTSNLKLFIALLVLLAIALVLVEHRTIEHVVPGTTGFFVGLGLK